MGPVRGGAGVVARVSRVARQRAILAHASASEHAFVPPYSAGGSASGVRTTLSSTESST